MEKKSFCVDSYGVINAQSSSVTLDYLVIYPQLLLLKINVQDTVQKLSSAEAKEGEATGEAQQLAECLELGRCVVSAGCSLRV